MKQSKLFHWLFPFIVISIPWIYLAIIWDQLPATVATHFDIDGKPNDFGPKSSIIFVPVVFTAVGIGTYFLLRNIHKIDPKKKYSETTSAVLSKLSIAVILLLCALSLYICYAALKGKTEGMPLFFCGLSLFFAYIGNLMHSIKPNYFAGFRLPWTLENEDNWRKTHQLASKIWFWSGIALAIFSLLLSPEVLTVIFMISVFIMAIIPAIYSYNLYRQHSKTNHAD